MARLKVACTGVRGVCVAAAASHRRSAELGGELVDVARLKPEAGTVTSWRGQRRRNTSASRARPEVGLDLLLGGMPLLVR
jgi:hypothetical protein